VGITHRWRKEAGPRLQGSRSLDSSKLQAPCIVRIPSGGFRLFYTAVGPSKPYPMCQGYILSAVSDDGLVFRTEPGIRLAPQPAIPHMSLRVLSPSVARAPDGRWRMYFESRGPADRPTVICSAVSPDMLDWRLEDGIRLQSPASLGGPRYLALPGTRGRMHCFAAEFGPGGPTTGERLSQSVISAVTSDGINFGFEPGYRMRDRQGAHDALGITAAEVIPPSAADGDWTMVFSAWQDVPPGTAAPVHPSRDPSAAADGANEDFARASIAADMAGYRSRIFVAYSADGLHWGRPECAIEGLGYGREGLDAVHAEDMSLADLGGGRFRMYYAACDKGGNWRIASAVTENSTPSAVEDL